ncbi:MAG: hypothetical protein RBS56_01675 [Candidatus Gracilibacteria bacterium]|nr:hypothetical protein [Candidatus Gracilibacteria bacterium]
MKIKANYIYISIFSLLIAFSLFSGSKVERVVFADEDDVLSFVAYGGFNYGINLTNVASPQNFSQTVYWNSTLGRDYLYFRDTTSTPGFTIQVYMSSTASGNFVYTGQSGSQGPIDKSNLKLYGNYFSGTPLEPTKGVDSDTTTLSVNSANSCVEAQNTSYFRFNDDLKDFGKNYSMAMSSSGLDYFSSGMYCDVEGRLDLRRLELTYPPNTADGVYESQFVILIIDGGEGEEV